MLSHALVENARTEQAESTSITALGMQAIILATLAVVLTVVGAVTTSAVITLSALVPLTGTVALFLIWNARELSKI